MQDILSVKIINPKKIIWEGKAESVSSENIDGPFDILPQHANFITVIENKPIIVVTDNKETKEFKFANAVIYIHDNTVNIYSEI